MEVSLGYTFDQDGLIRLQKDLNHLLTNLNDQNVKSIRTEYCRVSSKGRETIIDGSLLEMYDFDAATSKASTTLRLRAGYNKATSNFEFSLWNSVSTTPTFTVDSVGNAVFSGSINTSNSAFIGNNIFLGQTNSTFDKGLYFNATTPSTSESEGTSDMRSAIYINKSATGGFMMNINSTGTIDMISNQGIYIGNNIEDGIAVSTSNFLINFRPLVNIGDEYRYTAFLGFYYINDSSVTWRFASTSVLESKGYIDNSTPFKLSEKLKYWWNFQGRTMEEFNNTVGWTPSVNCYITAFATSGDKRCINNYGITMINNTTASGDLTIEKMYPDFNTLHTNNLGYATTQMLMYCLFYLYDLNLLDTLSTRAFQIELASSSGAGDKRRWSLNPSTSVSSLTTGWNLLTQRVDVGLLWTSSNASLYSNKFARFTFAVKANSTGRIATMQHFGFMLPDWLGSSNALLAPNPDRIHGWYGQGINTYDDKLTYFLRKNSTGVVLQSGLGMSMTSTNSWLYPTWSKAYGGLPFIRTQMNNNSKLIFIIKCKNDIGALPMCGIRSTIVDDAKAYVYATSNYIRLECIYDSTTLTVQTSNMGIAYDDTIKFTLWKEDTPIYHYASRLSNIRLLVEKVGTTSMLSLSYDWPVRWKEAAYVPFVQSYEPNVGHEIQEIEIARR